MPYAAGVARTHCKRLPLHTLAPDAMTIRHNLGDTVDENCSVYYLLDHLHACLDTIGRGRTAGWRSDR